MLAAVATLPLTSAAVSIAKAIDSAEVFIESACLLPKNSAHASLEVSYETSSVGLNEFTHTLARFGRLQNLECSNGSLTLIGIVNSSSPEFFKPVIKLAATSTAISSYFQSTIDSSGPFAHSARLAMAKRDSCSMLFEPVELLV